MRSDVCAKVDAGYLLEAMRTACLAIAGAIVDILFGLMESALETTTSDYHSVHDD